MLAAVFVLAGFGVLSYELVDGELTMSTETPRVFERSYGAVANVKDRRTVTAWVPPRGTSVIVKWRNRFFAGGYVLCENELGPAARSDRLSRSLSSFLCKSRSFC